MKIEAIITCVDYADFLAETLIHNLTHFDRVVVITSPDDRETAETCRRLSVEYYATDLFRAHGGAFSKARGIDFGLSLVRHGEWVCHIDADTYLPPLARWILEHRERLGTLDKESIYGVDRVNCVGYEAWREFVTQFHPGHDYMCRIKMPSNFTIGDRIAIWNYGGYLPIGYFQMWHASTGRRYPIVSRTAEHDDVVFSAQWPIGKKHLIPEIMAVHLMSEPATLGANWKGRKTKRFGPPGKPGVGQSYCK